MLISTALINSEVNSLKPKDYSDYKSLQITYNSTDAYSIVKKIGRGKYSEVFLGIKDETNENIVIKVLKPVAEMKIQRELKILTNLRGCKNIINLLDVVYDPLSGTPSFIFEHVDSINYKELYITFTDMDVRYYMYQLLLALETCHSRGIMHRDVKPQNIVIDHKKKKLCLIDWGLADFYHPKEKYNVRVASRYYKGPELLIDYQYYDYSLDLWAAGCTFAGMIFCKDTMFQGKDNQCQLLKIVKVLGYPSFQNYLNAYKIPLDQKLLKRMRDYERVPWNSFINKTNRHLVSHEALDLLDNMIRYDHQQRITAKAALTHPYFLPIHSQEKFVI